LPRGTECLLVVEDEPTLRTLATTMLREQGYNVLSASNGVEALAAVAEHPDVTLHLVVTDVVMPQMGGRDLVAKLRQTNAALKVLYTSGYTREVLPQEGIEEQNIFFLQKPYTTATLARKIREILDQIA
jgi:CheY-like chemotaxis protein